jgi:hypothetical protein
MKMLRKNAALAEASGNALCGLAVPSNVARWGQSGKHALDLKFTVYDPKRSHPAIALVHALPRF